MDMQETYFIGDALLIKKIGNSFKTYDLVYFKYPIKDSVYKTTYFFQRLIGLPGDTIQLLDKIVFINSIALNDTFTVKHNYHVKAKTALDSLFRLNNNLMEGSIISEKNDYSFSLTQKHADSLENIPFFEKIELEKEVKGNSDLSCFPYSNNYKWNMDNYGKLYIPKKNDTLKLDTINLVFYKKLIQDYEDNKLLVKHDSIFINNQFTASYCVKQNYYFTLSDNRDNSNDSRKWGFLPESYIIGKSIWLIKKAKR